MSDFVVMLTRGTLVVSADDAERITRAIERGEKTVEVTGDRLGDGFSQPMSVITAHVVTITAVPPPEPVPDNPFDTNVVSLESRRP